MRFEVRTKATPEQARRALTDFSDRRPEIWSRTLDARAYELRDHGDTWAVARESTSGSPFWVVCRYDWSDPDTVRWTVEESSYGGSGAGVVRIQPGADGGSRLLVEWSNRDARGLQKPLVVLLHRGPTSRLFARLWRTTLDRYAETDAG